MKIIFNADDFGLTEGVNNGIIQAYRQGLVCSTTMMMNGLAVHDAVKKAKQYPNLKTGVHLVLTFGQPLAQNNTLTNHAGVFKYTSVLKEAPDPSAVMEEWQTQIEAFLATGLSLHHLDSHHHVHGWQPLKEVILELSHLYEVPVRYMPSLHDSPQVTMTETLWTNFYANGVNGQLFDSLSILHATSVEVMTHPAIVDTTLKSITSYCEPRQHELELLCTMEAPTWATIVGKNKA